MKTTSVLSTLAIALPALASPVPADPCPGNDGGILNSGNNIQYTLYCGKDMTGDVIRKSDTQVGMPGCLAACDGTIDCTSVVYYPSDDDLTKGLCESRKSGGTQRNVSYEYAALAVRLTPEPSTTITAWPTATGTAAAKRAVASSFGGVAIASGSDIQYDSVNANGTYFWLNRGTEVYTPSTATASDQKNTIFAGGNNTLSLDVSAPGGQQVYVDSDGLLRYTVPHSAYTGTGSKSTGFSVANNILKFENSDFVACKLAQSPDNAYEVYAAAANTNTGSNCVGFEIMVSDNTGAAAYEYS